jgi:hypothetical protein
MNIYTNRELRLLEEQCFVNEKPSARHAHDRSLTFARIFQVSAFMLSFEMATAIASKRHWHDESEIWYSLTCTLVVALLGFPFGMMFGGTLARWSACMACSYHMTEINLLRILVICEAHRNKMDKELFDIGDDAEEMEGLVEEYEHVTHDRHHQLHDGSIDPCITSTSVVPVASTLAQTGGAVTLTDVEAEDEGRPGNKDSNVMSNALDFEVDMISSFPTTSKSCRTIDSKSQDSSTGSEDVIPGAVPITD